MTNSSFRIDARAVRPMQDAKRDVCILPDLRAIMPKLSEPEEVEEPEEEPGISEEELQAIARKEAMDAELAAAKAELERTRADIEQAKMDAKVIRQQAETDAQSVREKAHNEGYQSGIEEAKEEFARVRDREKKEFARSVQTLVTARQQIGAEMEPAVMDLAMFAAEKIVKESLNRNDEIYLNIVKDTIKEVEDNEEIVLRVNKKEYDRFFANDSDEYTDLLKSSGVVIRQDMAVESGECIVETEYGTLRSGVRTQLERMRAALEGAG